MKRLLHLTGERVTRLPPRAIEGESVSVVRVELAARNEDLGVDPTEPWTWDVENEPTLSVRGFAGSGASPERWR